MTPGKKCRSLNFSLWSFNTDNFTCKLFYHQTGNVLYRSYLRKLAQLRSKTETGNCSGESPLLRHVQLDDFVNTKTKRVSHTHTHPELSLSGERTHVTTAHVGRRAKEGDSYTCHSTRLGTHTPSVWTRMSQAAACLL